MLKPSIIQRAKGFAHSVKLGKPSAHRAALVVGESGLKNRVAFCRGVVMFDRVVAEETDLAKSRKLANGSGCVRETPPLSAKTVFSVLYNSDSKTTTLANGFLANGFGCVRKTGVLF